MLEFRLLGTVEAGADGNLVPLGGKKQRALLAYLLLNRNRSLARDALIDVLWPDDPPATAGHALDVYVSRLRKVLGADALIEARGGAVRIRIDDEGPGVPAEAREAIFNRFHSVRPEGENFGRHSGLGLAIAQAIVNGHDGEIDVQDRDDAPSGARFTIRLPAADRQ